MKPQIPPYTYIKNNTPTIIGFTKTLPYIYFLGRLGYFFQISQIYIYKEGRGISDLWTGNIK